MSRRVRSDWKREYRFELEHWPGVTYKFEGGSKHPRIVLSYKMRSRWHTLPSTASDHRAIRNSISHIRNLLRELGAHRVEVTPKSKRERQMQEEHMAERGGIAKLGINDVSVSFVIPKGSEIYDRFADNQHKAIAAWTFELRANPDPKGDPWFVVKKLKGDHKGKLSGAARGSYVKVNGSFNVAISRSKLPAIEKFGTFKTAPLELVESHDDFLVFKLPPNREPPMLRGKKKLEAIEQDTKSEIVSHEPSPPIESPPQELPTPEAINSELIAQILATISTQKSPDKMTLQLPERPLTVERCVNFLNKRVQSLGKNRLRFHLDHETGMISYIEKGGPNY